MEFKLIDTQQPDETNDDDHDELTSEDDDYNKMCKSKKGPVVSSLENKRTNKTVECPNCHRKMNSKTYKYSHKCPHTAKVKEDAQTEIELTKPPDQQKTINPTKQDIQTMIREQELLKRQYLIQQKQEKINKLLSHAF